MKPPLVIVKAVLRIGVLGFLIMTLVKDSVADTFWIEGLEQPIYGRFVNEENGVVTIKRTIDGLNFEETKLKRGQIRASVINYDTNRLAALKPNDFAAYRDFAEELTSQAADPVARLLAVRLYVIAAANGDPDLRVSSLAGLSQIAKTDREKTVWKKLRYLYDANSGLELPIEAGDKLQPSDATQQKMLLLVQSLRKSEDQEIEKDVVDYWSDVISREELMSISRSNRPTTEQFRKLLQIEFQIRNPDPSSVLKSDTRWGALSKLNSSPSAEVPSLSSATSFDPKNSIFRKGKWIAPTLDRK